MAEIHEHYWRAFERYLRETGNGDIELIVHYAESRNYRLIWIAGVPSTGSNLFVEWPHFAVAATLRRTKHGPAGARTQLVVPKRHFYYSLSERRSAIAREIPSACWVPPDEPVGETGHVEVRAPHHVGNRDAWPEDFAWFVENLRVFQAKLAPHVLATL